MSTIGKSRDRKQRSSCKGRGKRKGVGGSLALGSRVWGWLQGFVKILKVTESHIKRMNFMEYKFYFNFLERNKSEEAEWAPFLSLLLLNFLL